MEQLLEGFEERFYEGVSNFQQAPQFTKRDKAQKLSSIIDVIASKENGIDFIYKNIKPLIEAGFFYGTAWNEPENLVPTLVGGTLKSGHPNSTYETVSELRMLAIAENQLSHPSVSVDEASQYLEEIMVLNLDLAFSVATEELRVKLDDQEKNKIYALFQFLLSRMDLDGIKDKLAEEVEQLIEDRPVVTRRIRRILGMVEQRVTLKKGHSADDKLAHYLKALRAPSNLSERFPNEYEYRNTLNTLDEDSLAKECKQCGESMAATGLVSSYHVVLMQYIVDKHPDYISQALGLSTGGEVELETHFAFVQRLLRIVADENTSQSIYGLSQTLERKLFSRSTVKHALERLLQVDIHPDVQEEILKSEKQGNPYQLLIEGTLRVLGQPLGIGQGNNPTCQSARGISMWSSHGPAKLINLINTAASTNNLAFRFENVVIESKNVLEGLTPNLDYDLDIVSIVLVPHLDKIYNEMMKRTALRGEDPHKWVNPALYGQWVQIGFASVYNPLTHSIDKFDNFIRTFYAAYNPRYNEDESIVYPVPIGIFITSSKGQMLGFHAISLLRVDKDQEGELRAYFLNPNNDGRQNWGQGITPTVTGNGERHGESSLPLYQFAARLYAFHYNNLIVDDRIPTVDQSEVDRVKTLAKESWGKSYNWL